MVMEDHGDMIIYYLDKETGEVIPLLENAYIKEEEPVREQIENNPSCYIPIDPMPLRNSFKFRGEFVESLPDGEDKRLLKRALEWRKPFSNFKDALYDMPEIRDCWFAVKNECMHRYILEWLEDIDWT